MRSQDDEPADAVDLPLDDEPLRVGDRGAERCHAVVCVELRPHGRKHVAKLIRRRRASAGRRKSCWRVDTLEYGHEIPVGVDEAELTRPPWSVFNGCVRMNDT